MAEHQGTAPSPIAQFVGSWRLLSFETEAQDTGERRASLGPAPNGRLVVLRSGVLIVVITGNGRQPPKSAEERAGAFDSMMAYAGRITITGDQITTNIDISWNEGWVGEAQARTFRFVDDRLELVTAWTPSPFAPKKIGRAILYWEREA